MTKEEKELLLGDLCARLQYGVKVNHFGAIRELLGIIPAAEIVMVGYDINDYEDSVIEDIKPYLRPMESMTIAERNELADIPNITIYENGETISNGRDIDWLNEKMFDYRGLIEKGLALSAKDGMYNMSQPN